MTAMTQAEMLRRVGAGFDTLDNWEKARYEEWRSKDERGFSLSAAQLRILDRMLNDVNDGKKSMTKEVFDRAKLATENQSKLYPTETDFVHRISKLRIGIDKTSKAERAWLIKIENRIHKN